MTQDRFASLPLEFPRTYVPADVDAGNWDSIAPLYDELENRPLETVEQLERWLRDASELDGVVSEEMAMRYIRMSCDTENSEHEEAHLHFIREILPQAKVRGQALDSHYLASPARKERDGDRYTVLDRAKENQVALFREENVPLEAQDAELSQKYMKVCGAQTVELDGEEVTLQRASKELFSTDRARREDVWKMVWGRRLEDRAAAEGIYETLVGIRSEMGDNAGFESFRDYRHQKLARFDYTPGHCEAFHLAVEEKVVPALVEIRKDRQEKLGVETLRPWDLAVDPKGREALAPFETADELIAGVSTIFHRLDPVLGGQFDQMRDLDLLDLESRKGKAPGGYQYPLSEARLQFIFMNAVGLHGDVRTLLHEGGHAFHSMACRDEWLIDYRHAPMEFCEVASMSMELIGAGYLDTFYDEADAARARKEMLTGALDILPWVASIDSFQHWVYTHPGHSPEDRRNTWRGIMDRFATGVDWSGHEDVLDARWLFQSHLFSAPFYYIEYGIAQLGALQVWSNARRDPVEALRKYRAALALGGSRPLPEIFETAGTRFDFGPETVGPLVDAVQEELAALRDV